MFNKNIIYHPFDYYLIESLYTDHPHQEITYPSIVDNLGSHVSYDLDSLSAHDRQKRTVGNQEFVSDKLKTYIRIDAFGQSLYLNVSLNSDFLHGNGPTVEYMQSNGSSTLQGLKHRDCFHVGHVHLVTDSSTGEEVTQTPAESAQWVSISNCAGLVSKRCIVAEYLSVLSNREVSLILVCILRHIGIQISPYHLIEMLAFHRVHIKIVICT